MTRKVELGVPSLTGKDCNDLVAKEFAKVKYPLTVTVTNHMPRDAVFPEVDGLHLRHCSNEDGRSKTVEIHSEDQLQRLASSVEQVAELNGYALALTIEDAAPAPAKVSKTKAEATAGADEQQAQ